MNLIIDVGNTRVKFAVFHRRRIVEQYVSSSLSFDELEKITIMFNIEGVIISTVGKMELNIRHFFENKGIFFLDVDYNTPLPIENLYDTPHTLGIDRLMAAVGANAIFPETELLIIDLGSAITLDRVSADGKFLGGNISPGMEMRFKALNLFTARLPRCNFRENIGFCEKNTEGAIIGGVVHGIACELDGYIDIFMAKTVKKKIIFTGGDAKYFVNKVKNAIFVDCDLLLKGLNKVLEYNNYVEN